MSDRLLGSVIIPAHDEASVIERCLRGLLADLPAGVLDVVVVCNGCTDGTAARARATGLPVRVIELQQACKLAALAVGDAEAFAFPRLYLDADVVLPGRSAVAVLARLGRGDILAARPPLRYDLTGCSALVRRYYAARVLIPGMLTRLWGAGVYGLSRSGRERFGPWPQIVADDLFIDSLFEDEELEVVQAEPVRVTAPRTARDLLSVLRRGARAKSPRQRAQAADGRALPLRHGLGSTLRGLAAVVGRRPWLLPDALVYLGFAAAGRIRPQRGRTPTWERDHSTRAAL